MTPFLLYVYFIQNQKYQEEILVNYYSEQNMANFDSTATPRCCPFNLYLCLINSDAMSPLSAPEIHLVIFFINYIAVKLITFWTVLYTLHTLQDEKPF